MAVIDRSSRTYQASDLAGTARRDFINDARVGVARLRDTDGSSLAMLPAADLEFLTEVRTVALAYLALENALSRPREHRRVTDFGELAWAAVLDEADLGELRDELQEGLARALTVRSFEEITEMFRAWRLTARLLSRPDAEERLSTATDETEWSELSRPEASES